jgi:hypothetical protein
MKNLLMTICEENGYVIAPNKSGITLDLLIDAALSENTSEYVRNATGCAKETVTRAIRNTFPDRDAIHDSSISKFLLAKWNLRKCAKCSEIKDISEFYTNKNKGDGIATQCKICSKQSRIDTYNKDPHKEIHAADLRDKRIKEYQTPSWANIKAITAFYKARPEGYHVDHIIPLNGALVSGLHVENNLQYLSANENLSKSNKYAPVV